MWCMHYDDNDESNYTQIKGYYINVLWALGCLEYAQTVVFMCR